MKNHFKWDLLKGVSWNWMKYILILHSMNGAWYVLGSRRTYETKWNSTGNGWKCFRTGISVSGTIGVLVCAVGKKLISRQEADYLLSEMIAKGFYSPIKKLEELNPYDSWSIR